MSYKNILFTVDLSDEHSWEKALPEAIAMTQASGATLHIMTVVPLFSGVSLVEQFFPKDKAQQIIEQARLQLHEFTEQHLPEGLKVHHIVGDGNIYETILETAKKTKADLIIMAAHRPDLKDYLLGPNAARVVRHAACSVLVVR